jgi:hypothetical protein
MAPRPHRWLFVTLALVMLAIVVVAFTPTLYLRSTLPYLDTQVGHRTLPVHLLVHGVVLTAWFVLFVVQTWLVAIRNVRVHRQLGIVTALNAIAVIASAVYTIVQLTPRSVAAAHASGVPADRIERGIERFVVPIVIGDSVALLLFALFVGAAIYWRRRPATHKRLMLLATVMILGPAFADGRPVGQVLAQFLPSGVAYIAAIWLCVFALVWHDRVTTRRLEPATIWAAVVIVVVGTLSVLITSRIGGAAIARWLVS